MRRPYLTLAPLALTLALITWATPARADFLHFTISDDPSTSHSTPGSLHFGLDFSLHGSAPVSFASPDDLSTAFPPIHITGGRISFDFGRPYSTSSDDDAWYRGGSIAVYGSIGGGPDELLFQSSSIATTTLTPASGDQYYLKANSVVGLLSASLAGRAGVEPWIGGTFYLGFHADAREDYALSGDHAAFALDGVPMAAVPEPGSLMMVGLAGVMGGGVWVKRRARGTGSFSGRVSVKA